MATKKQQKVKHPWNYGKKTSDEIKQKISDALKGNVVPWNRGKKTGVTPANKGKRWDKKLKKYVPKPAPKKRASKEKQK